MKLNWQPLVYTISYWHKIKDVENGIYCYSRRVKIKRKLSSHYSFYGETDWLLICHSLQNECMGLRYEGWVVRSLLCCGRILICSCICLALIESWVFFWGITVCHAISWLYQHFTNGVWLCIWYNFLYDHQCILVSFSALIALGCFWRIGLMCVYIIFEAIWFDSNWNGLSISFAYLLIYTGFGLLDISEHHYIPHKKFALEFEGIWDF